MTECDKPYKAKPMERQADGFNVIGPTADGLVLKVPCPSLGEATFLAMALNLAHDRGYSLATAALEERDKRIAELEADLKLRDEWCEGFSDADRAVIHHVVSPAFVCGSLPSKWHHVICVLAGVLHKQDAEIERLRKLCQLAINTAINLHNDECSAQCVTCAKVRELQGLIEPNKKGGGDE